MCNALKNFKGLGQDQRAEKGNSRNYPLLFPISAWCPSGNTGQCVQKTAVFGAMTHKLPATVDNYNHRGTMFPNAWTINPSVVQRLRGIYKRPFISLIIGLLPT